MARMAVADNRQLELMRTDFDFDDIMDTLLVTADVDTLADLVLHNEPDVEYVEEDTRMHLMSSNVNNNDSNTKNRKVHHHHLSDLLSIVVEEAS